MMHRSFSGSPFAGPSREFMTLPALDSVVVPLAMRVRWIFDWLNMQPDDEFVDMFPGSGAVTQAHYDWLAARNGNFQQGLFA